MFLSQTEDQAEETAEHSKGVESPENPSRQIGSLEFNLSITLKTS